MGLMSPARARHHPERSALNRCLGHELIVAVDRITLPLQPNDQLLVCTDGLYSVIEDQELGQLISGLGASTACQRLVDIANQRGTADNLAVAILPRGWIPQRHVQAGAGA
jgi:protein phosphatase